MSGISVPPKQFLEAGGHFSRFEEIHVNALAGKVWCCTSKYQLLKRRAKPVMFFTGSSICWYEVVHTDA